MAVAVAAIRALTSVIRNSGAQTMMGLEKELKDAAAALQRCNPTSISLKAGCELFLRYTTRTSALEMEDFAGAKARLIEVRSAAPAPVVGLGLERPWFGWSSCMSLSLGIGYQRSSSRGWIPAQQ